VDGRGGKEQGSPYPIEGSHAYVSTTKKSAKLRLVSFIQVGEQHEVVQKNETYVCGDWTLVPEMNGGRMANLQVHNKGKSASFLLKSTETGESILTEEINGKPQVFKAVDELPYATLDVEYTANLNSGK
jgi:hypothetical protein